MGIIFDICVIAIMALSIFLGYRKGLVKIAVKLCAFLIAIIVSLVFYKPVSNLIIINTELDEKIEDVIAGKFTEEKNIDESDKSFLNNIQVYIDDTIVETKNGIVENVSKEISERLINILAMIGIFIVTRLILILLVLISDLITNIPIIKQFNKLGGVFYGIIRGMLLIYGILSIVFLVISISSNNNILTTIDSSFITKFMYENNILLNIIF